MPKRKAISALSTSCKKKITDKSANSCQLEENDNLVFKEFNEEGKREEREIEQNLEFGYKNTLKPVGKGPHPELCYICHTPSQSGNDVMVCSFRCKRGFHERCLALQGDGSCGKCSADWWTCFNCKESKLNIELEQCQHVGCHLFYCKSCMYEMQPESHIPKQVKELLMKMKTRIKLADKENKKKEPFICSRHRCATCVRKFRELKEDSGWNPDQKQLISCRKCPISVHLHHLCWPADYRRNEFNTKFMTCSKHHDEIGVKGDDAAIVMLKRHERQFFLLADLKFRQDLQFCVVCARSTTAAKPELLQCTACAAVIHSHPSCFKKLEKRGGITSKISDERKWTCPLCAHVYHGKVPFNDASRPIPLFMINDFVWFPHRDYKMPWPYRVFGLDDLPEKLSCMKQFLPDGPCVALRCVNSNVYTLAKTSLLLTFQRSYYMDTMSPTEIKYRFNHRTIISSSCKAIHEAAWQRASFAPELLKLQIRSFNYYPTNYEKRTTNVKPKNAPKLLAEKCECIPDCICGMNSGCPCVIDYRYCNSGKCGKTCLNQGKEMSNAVYVDVAGDAGYGLFAKTGIKKGERIMQYIGELITANEHKNRKKLKEIAGDVHYYHFELMIKGWYIDAEYYGNSSRFLNHSCDPNCTVQQWGKGKDPVLALVTKKNIKEADELTIDYSYTCEEGDNPGRCYCSSNNCKGLFRRIKKKTDFSNGPLKNRMQKNQN